MLLLLLGCLQLLLLRCLMLLLLLGCLMLLLRGGLVADLHACRRPHVAIGRERLAHCGAGRTAMIDIGELSPVSAGCPLILDLRPHWSSVLFMQSRNLRRSGPDLHTARSAVEAGAYAAPVAVGDGSAVDVVNPG